MGKKSFNKVVLCLSGEFSERHDKIKHWVSLQGGRVEHSLTPEVTHVVASAKAWKGGSDLIRNALKKKAVKVVTYDWLEDSLMSKSGTPKSATKYLWSSLDKVRRQKTLDKVFVRTEKIRKKLTQFDKDCEQLARELRTEGWHLWTDPTQFTYSITLARPNILNNKIERYQIKVRNHSSPDCPLPVPVYYLSPTQIRPIIFLPPQPPFPTPHRVPPVKPLAQQLQIVESDSMPHTYGLLVQYFCHGKKPGSDLLCPLGSTFEFAFKNFRTFFKRKTGIDWERRCENLRGPEMGADGTDTFVVDELTGVRVSGWYRYMPPTGTEEGRGLMVGGGSGGRKQPFGEITVIQPVKEVSMTAGDVDAKARTPDGGW